MHSVKYFKLDDPPSAQGRTQEEVKQIQDQLKNVPPHMVISELKNIEMKQDRECMIKKKEEDERMRSLLDAMTPLVTFRSLALGKFCWVLTT